MERRARGAYAGITSRPQTVRRDARRVDQDFWCLVLCRIVQERLSSVLSMLITNLSSIDFEA